MTTNDFLDQDVPDPTDFPPPDVAPGLRELDDALRCSICGELYQAPITVLCGHCFCSLCIRTSLANKPECPLCRQATNEHHFRKAQAVEDAVKAWNQARPYILNLCREEEKRKAQPPLPSPKTPSRRENDTRRTKKRKLSTPSDSEDVIELSKPPTPTGFNLVECPACQRRLPLDDINGHLDRQCAEISEPGPSTSRGAAKGKQKQDWQKVFKGAAQEPSSGSGKLKAKTKCVASTTPSLSLRGR
ncbi:RING/U-box [Panus rudis PR-1116 ss-1]|nr:RING/U-box [Panus rudis PR-1116 ss-1]